MHANVRSCIDKDVDAAVRRLLDQLAQITIGRMKSVSPNAHRAGCHSNTRCGSVYTRSGVLELRTQLLGIVVPRVGLGLELWASQQNYVHVAATRGHEGAPSF